MEATENIKTEEAVGTEETKCDDFCDCAEELEETIEGGEEKYFDFEKFNIYIKKSIIQKDSEIVDVDLDNYLSAYEQLYNFFILMGKGFQFVALDVKSKIKILRAFQLGEHDKEKSSRNFSTVTTMINYEYSNNMFANSKYVSGSRTLLRLHRGLDFVRKFLEVIYNLNNDAKLCTHARDVYNQTLAEYHSWIIKNAARLAMQFLPTRGQLLQQISDRNEVKLNQVLEVFPEAMNSMNKVYDKVQQIYSEKDLLNLP